MWEEYENAIDGDIDPNKKIVKLGELNELACEDLIFQSTLVLLSETYH